MSKLTAMKEICPYCFGEGQVPTGYSKMEGSLVEIEYEICPNCHGEMLIEEIEEEEEKHV